MSLLDWIREPDLYDGICDLKWITRWMDRRPLAAAYAHNDMLVALQRIAREGQDDEGKTADNPLDVIWLCPIHHAAEHKRARASQ